MTKSSWISHSLFAALFVVVLAMPAYALAAVKIVDVMYDPPGADTGHEWIEIANTGPDTVNLAGYRLYEGGTNHKLNVAQGTSTLAAGDKAILATDPTQYETDNPSFAGTIFKSSFSLSNTGETIELKDASLKVVDSYSYVAPPVVKEPAPAKVAATPAKSKSKTKSTGASSYAYAAGNTQAASAALASVPAVPKVWLYGLGLLTLLVLCAAAALFVWPEPKVATLTSGEEFEIE